MLPLLSILSPNAAIVILTLGLALIAIELNRPGSVLPGALGLLLTLLCSAALLHRGPQPLAFALLFAGATVLLLQLRWNIRLWTVCLAAAAATVGFALLPGVTLPVAILCGVLLSGGTTILTRIAHRARQNKGLD